MYNETIQSSPLVLFSSLPISSPFQNSSISIDSDLTQDSFICLIDDKTSKPIKSPQSNSNSNSLSIYKSNQTKSKNPITLKEIIETTNQEENIKILGSNDPLNSIRSTVLHLQSPNCKSTFIRFPSMIKPQEKLGIKLPFLHLQIKALNHHFLFEIEVHDDELNHSLRLRFSSFQKEAKLYPPKSSSPTQSSLLHIPIHPPSSSSSKQTNWSELIIPVKQIVETYTKLRFSSINWIQIHSNLRLRRIFCSIDGKGFAGGGGEMNQSVYDFRNRRVVVLDELGQRNQRIGDQRVELMLFRSSTT